MREQQERKREEKAHRRTTAPPSRESAPPQQQLPQMLRVKHVAKLLSVSPQTVRRWFSPRAVVVPGGKATILIPQQVVADWIREHANR